MGHDNRDLLPMGSSFDISRRGYDRGQVDEHLDRLDAELRILAADRDAAVAHAAELAKQVENQRNQLERYEHELALLSTAPTSMEGLSERMQRMLRLAQDEATEIKSRAETEAAELMSRTEADGAALRDRYQRLLAELDARRANLDEEHRGILGRAQAEADRLVSEAQAEATRLEEESAARRTQVDEDFDIAMSARRTEAMRVLAEVEASSKHEAERRVQAATEEANRRLAEATEQAQRCIVGAKAQVEHLRTVRSRVSAQLRQLHSVLASAASALEPLPHEEDPAGVAAAGASALLAGPGPDGPPAPASRPEETTQVIDARAIAATEVMDTRSATSATEVLDTRSVPTTTTATKVLDTRAGEAGPDSDTEVLDVRGTTGAPPAEPTEVNEPPTSTPHAENDQMLQEPAARPEPAVAQTQKSASGRGNSAARASGSGGGRGRAAAGRRR